MEKEPREQHENVTALYLAAAAVIFAAIFALLLLE